jgi:hypothetical protein
MRMQEKMKPVMHCVFRGTFVLGLVLFAWGFPAFASAQENCQLKIPPSQAAISANHGIYFFVYPRSVNAVYSGCQTMWDEKGNQWFVLMFEQGSLIKYESNDPSGASKKQSCRYEHGKLARNESKDCPDYGDVKDGFRTLSNSDEPIVPSARDPRR